MISNHVESSLIDEPGGGAPPVALTIAGSDSGGGAGLQADLKTFAALRVYGTCAVTIVTAQNTTGVKAAHAVPPALVVAQVEAVLADLPVAAVKTGMLGAADLVTAVAALAAGGWLPSLVVDPVLVNSRGEPMFDVEVRRAYVEELLPHAVVTTPNLREAEVLTGHPIESLAGQRAAAEAIGALGPSTVVVKGGRAVADTAGEAVDVVWHDGALTELRAPRLATRNNHGSGCSFAAAIAANLAHGRSVDESIDEAKAYVWRAVSGAATWSLGAGHGPLDHFTWS